MCKGGPILHEFIYNNIQLEIVVSFKYLGINLYNNGCWLRTHKRTAHHSVYGLHNLFIILNQLNLNTNDKCNLFESLVGSVLNTEQKSGDILSK